MNNCKAWLLAGAFVTMSIVAAGSEQVAPNVMWSSRLPAYRLARYHGHRADLTNAKLCGAALAGANLQGARLITADLRGADLSRADLRDATLVGADLEGADLTGADLRGASVLSFVFVRIQGSDSYRSVEKPTNLRRANLRGADLRNVAWELLTKDGTPITGLWAWGAPLLGGATYDDRTHWPAGYDPLKDGAILVK
jgi:hypothetical protein